MNNVEERFPESRIHSFLKDITELCKKHKVSIYTDEVSGKSYGRFTAIVDFDNWDNFSELEADSTSSSVYWPRIETHVMHEESKVAEKEISWEEKQGIAQPTLHHSAKEEKS